jgi:hydroxymethylpyrimidine pyrophosphatase-like HAD family hydrolase
MSRYYRAIAVDYDGTLTEADAPDPTVLAAIRRTRSGGRRFVLVTGRIMESLLASFPDAESTFDAIVAENGGVIWHQASGARAFPPRSRCWSPSPLPPPP